MRCVRSIPARRDRSLDAVITSFGQPFRLERVVRQRRKKIAFSLKKNVHMTIFRRINFSQALQPSDVKTAIMPFHERFNFVAADIVFPAVFFSFQIETGTQSIAAEADPAYNQNAYRVNASASAI